MKGLISIMDFLTHHSVISLDEPCTSSASDDGVCIAVSICIKILNTKAFAFCTSHHQYLPRLADTFLNVTK